MSVEESARDFATLPKGEQFKDELEGFYHDPPPSEQLKKIIKYQTAPQTRWNHFILLLIVLLLLVIVVIATNYHLSSKVLKAVEAAGAEQGREDGPAGEKSPSKISDKLQQMQANERKIMAKLSEMSVKLGNLDGNTVNVVQDVSVSDKVGQKSGTLDQLKQDIDSLSKQLTLINHDLASANKNIEAQTGQSLSQLAEIKDLILKNAELNEKAAQRPFEPSKANDERPFQADFSIESEAQQRFTASSQVHVGEDYIFNIPKKVWMFKKESHSNYLDELCYKNNAHFASISNYDIVYIDMNNYRQHLTPKGGDTIYKFIEFLKRRVQANDPSNLRYHIDSIASKLILFTILQQNGGIVTFGEYAMTEDLTWIEKIMTNPYVNRGNRGIKPQVVGFYSLDYSLEKTKEKLRPAAGLQETDKYVTLFPALENYFIAAQKDTKFMRRVLEQIMKLLRRPAQFRREKGHYKLINLKGEDIYYEYFLIAVQVVLQQKQKDIDSTKIDNFRHFAIDFYGLQLINCYYAPYKLKAFWGDGQSNKAFQSLSQYTQEQLFANIGPMRYIARITPTNEMSSYLVDTKNGKRPPILMGSFMQRIFYPQGTQLFIQKNPQVPFVNSSSAAWAALPKTIWVFWDKGLVNAGINNQICVQNLRRMGSLSGFEVVEVNMSNIHEYLDTDTVQKIETTILHAKLKTYPQSKADLYRLALLAKFGGIYMDASYIALQSFDWLLNIGKYPSQYIFNRYGDLPRVFMMWHPHYGAPLQWTINKQYSVKSQWHLAYENNFIAAEKGSELITEWFQLLLQLYSKDYSEVERVFQDCQMYSNKWSTSNWHYLIPMDTIKCVVGRREVMLAQEGNGSFASASDYYKLWSMSGYLGQQKLRSNTNFESPGSQDNLFVYRYSQDYVEGLIGKVRHLAKFYSNHNKALSMFAGRHTDGNFTSEAHPESIFMRHMWHPKFRIDEVNFQPRLRVLP